MNTRKLVHAVVLTSATLSLTAGAVAGNVTEVSAPSSGELASFTVQIADINLATPAGQEVLDRRLNAAAEKVCGSSRLHKAGSVKQATRNGECQEAARSRAMARIHSAAVAAR
jgi:UrcA family protein